MFAALGKFKKKKKIIIKVLGELFSYELWCYVLAYARKTYSGQL